MTHHRILLILETIHGQIGGTEQNTLRFAQALLERGHHPTIVEVGSKILSKSDDARGLELFNVPATKFEDVTIKEWRNLIKETRPQIIIRSKTWVGCVNWKLDLVAYLADAQYLGWEHHPANEPVNDNVKIKTQIKRFIRKWLHARAVKRSVAVSNAVRDPLIEFFPVPASKIDLIYPGVDFAIFKHTGRAREELRAVWGIPQSAFVIGSLGRLVAHKGNDFTLRVMAELLKKNPELDVWCVLAGRGPDLARLQKLAEEFGIIERVCFPGWQESAPKAWNALDLFLMPSSDEGLGMTLIEAAACGCMPLGAAVGGMKEILSGPLITYSLPPVDTDAWATAVARVISLTSLQRKQEHEIVYDDLRRRFDASIQWNLMVDWVEAQVS
ncbi:MAG: glycosyltransferase [Gammaproteobacteria bacterium]|nr:MAG: glycosyltransferase [Gammaproteobacteria bacterium]